MIRNLLVLAALAITVAVPFLLRPKEDLLARADRTLVIISPHNEAIRYEFARAFNEYMRGKTGESVRIDWRVPGGTSEIARYLESEFIASFQLYWTRELRRPWNAAVQSAFHDWRIELPGDAAQDDERQAARRAYLESNVGCGIDLFFGGGSYDFILQAQAGRLADCGVIRAHPELFHDDAIPQSLGGEPYWDSEGRWIGVCLGGFGICYNTDVLARLGMEQPPMQWADLADPALLGQVALADPSKSGSITKAFEMLVQQQMHQRMKRSRAEAGDPKQLERDAVHAGWEDALRLILRISGNARYFTDSSSKVPIDVSLGDAAAGMSIDFYGRFQSESVRRADGASRMGYITPLGGTSVGADSVALVRGAPERELAVEFIEFLLSIEGQKLWNFKVGAPGGPTKFALRRLPIRRELYAPEHRQFRSDPEVDPYFEASAFDFRAEWTGQLFSPLRFIIRVMCLDPHDELRDAWRELVRAGFPPRATEAFLDVSRVDYERALGPIRDALRSRNKLDEVRLARELSDGFRGQFALARQLAKEGK